MRNNYIDLYNKTTLLFVDNWIFPHLSSPAVGA